MPLGWLNTDFYESTREVIGILPIPGDIKDACGILSHFPTLTGSGQLHPKMRHKYLAMCQGTRKAVLPVHTKHESELFERLLQHDPAFSTIQGVHPNWSEAVKLWNTYAVKENDVYFKVSPSHPRHTQPSHTDLSVPYQLPEHLQSHWTEFKARVNRKASASMTYDERHGVDTTVRNADRSIGAPSIEPEHLHPHFVHHGFRALSPTDPNLQHPPTHAPSQQPSQQDSSTHFESEPSQHQEHSTSSTPSDMSVDTPAVPLTHSPEHGSLVTMTALSQQLVNPSIESASSSESTESRRRRPRHCMKCQGLGGCGGRQQVENCEQPCFDCGKVECLGRSSKHPKKKCWDVKPLMEEKRRKKEQKNG